MTKLRLMVPGFTYSSSSCLTLLGAAGAAIMCGRGGGTPSCRPYSSNVPVDPEKVRFVKSSLTLAFASQVVDRCLQIQNERGLLPLAVTVLDSGGGLTAMKRQDGCAVMRVDIANAKAYAALSMGMSTRLLRDRLSSRPTFMASLSALGAQAGKGWVAVPGGVLILDVAGAVVGAVGVSGDTSDKDEMAAIEAICSVGKEFGGAFFPDPAAPTPGWESSNLTH